MLNNIKILTNVESVNSFNVVDILHIQQGTYPLPFRIMLWQDDLNERYVPADGTTVTVEFIRMNTISQTPESRTVVKSLSQIYPDDDKSIWGCDLINNDIINVETGGFRITIMEGGDVYTVYSKMTLRKEAYSDWPLSDDPTGSGLIPTSPIDSLWERINAVLYPVFPNDSVDIGDGDFTGRDIYCRNVIPTGTVDGIDVSDLNTTVQGHVTDTSIHHTQEQIEDIAGGMVEDTVSIDLEYDDLAGKISGVVLPAGVDHNSLANLTAGNPHIQYILKSLLTDKGDLIVRDGTGVNKLPIGLDDQILAPDALESLGMKWVNLQAVRVKVTGTYPNIGSPADVEAALSNIDSVIASENIWDRAGTVIVPHNAGDGLDLGTGNIALTGTVDGVDISLISLSNMPVVPTGDVDFNTQDITNVGNVDGRDVSADGTALDTHLTDVGFKHKAARIQVVGTYVNIGSPTDVETALSNIDGVIAAENIWDRTGTIITPKNAGDDINLGVGNIILGGTVDGRDVSDDGDTLDNHVTDGSIHFLQTDINHDNLLGLSDDDHTQYSLVDGSRAFTGAVVGVSPSLNTHLATKGYVDALVQGLSWQDAVLDKDLVTSPPPIIGARYIIAGIGGDWSGFTIGDIVEYDGSDWNNWTPDESFATWVQDEDVLYVYNGVSWIKFGSTVDHGNLLGLGDDDHTQYLLISGLRAMLGNLDMGSNDITNVDTVDGIDISSIALDNMPAAATGNIDCDGQAVTNVGLVDGVDISAISLSNMPAAASGNIDCGGQAITNVGNVDGRDVSADGGVLDGHLLDTLNPHSVTKAQVGLTNVTDDAQIAKSIGNVKGDIIVYTADDTPSILSAGVDGKILTTDSLEATGLKWVDPPTGNVVGPAGATDHALVRFDLATGKLIQDSLAILSDAGALSGIVSVQLDGVADGGILGFDGGITKYIKSDSSGDELEISGFNKHLFINQGQRVKRTLVDDDYDVLDTDFLLGVDTSVARAIQLMSTTVAAGKWYCIKDESGNASVNAITISTEGAEKIDGQDTFVMNQDYQAIWLYSDGSHWYIM